MAQLNGWGQTGKVAGALIAVITLLSLLSVGMIRLLDLETRPAHMADIERLEMKLDCALFDLPRGCRDRLGPR